MSVPVILRPDETVSIYGHARRWAVMVKTGDFHASYQGDEDQPLHDCLAQALQVSRGEAELHELTAGRA